MKIINGKPIRTGRGKGSHFRRSVSAESSRMLDTGSTAGVVANGKAGYHPAMFDCSETEEQSDIAVPLRKSLTKQLHLKIFPQTVETELIKTRQRDRKTGQMVEVSNPRIVWKSDKNLLRKGKPDQMPAGYMRVTSQSKRRRYEPEQPATLEVPITPELDETL